MTGHVAPARLAASSGAERRALLEHVRACAGCRAAVASHDPADLFALLALAPVPETVLELVSRDVGRAVETLAPGAAPFARRLAAAAVLAFAALTGALTLTQRPLPRPGAGFAARADVEVAPAAAVSGVVDFSVGTTQVVMVYNGDLKL